MSTTPRPGGFRAPGAPQRPSAPPGGQAQPSGLPPRYLAEGYFDGRGSIHENLIVTDAERIALGLEAGGMTRSLLRNFYNEVCTLRHLVRTRPDDFNRLQPRILKLRAHAANALNRRTSKAPEMFFRFIDQNVDKGSKDVKSFLEGFCEHFECVVLYFKGR